jgi:two-component system response regulator YesN
MRIVVVDDESLIGQGLSRMLAVQQEEDWHLSVVYHDAEEALETCNWDTADVLLADINMPGMSGLEMVETLRERGWDTPVIIISGYAQFEYARAAMLNNAVDFIVKPVAPDKLFSALRKAQSILAERAAERNSRRFIEGNMNRLTREYLSEVLFEARAMPEEERRKLFDSFGLEGKSYALFVFLSGGRSEGIPALLEAARGEQKATLYGYPSGTGLNTVLALCREPGDFDPGAFRALAGKHAVDIAWYGFARTGSLDALNRLYIGLLEQMRDSRAMEALRAPAKRAEGSDPLNMKGDYSPPVREAIRLIQQEYARPLSLTILSEKVDVHPTYLSNVFKKQTGLALIDFINHYRVEQAKKLLEDPLTRIYWVGEQVGFANQRYFSQVFKKIVGLTPVEYRSTCYLRRT